MPAAALAPAFVAACLAARDASGDASMRGRGWRFAATAGTLWALLLLGGDPAVAALALARGGAGDGLVRGGAPAQAGATATAGCRRRRCRRRGTNAGRE